MRIGRLKRVGQAIKDDAMRAETHHDVYQALDAVDRRTDSLTVSLPETRDIGDVQQYVREG